MIHEKIPTFASYDYEAKAAFDLKGDSVLLSSVKIDLPEYDDTHVLDTQTGNVTVLTGEMTLTIKKMQNRLHFTKEWRHLCEWCNPD